jgi:hypothetical protein
MSLRRELNEYLVAELGLDDEEDGSGRSSKATKTWPFDLQDAGILDVAGRSLHVFLFEHDEPHFALAGETLSFYPRAGMAVPDLILQEEGAAWIAARDPVDLATSRMDDSRVPSALERRAHLEALASELPAAAGGVRLLEGLYLAKSRTFLALVECTSTQEVFAVGTSFAAMRADFPNASAWRRLAHAIGRSLRAQFQS